MSNERQPLDLVQAGQYYGKLLDYGLYRNEKNGAWSAILEIEFLALCDSGAEKKLRLKWFGGLSTDNSKAFTLKTLWDLGYQSNSVKLLNGGKANGQLEVNQEVRITVERSVYNGKDSARIIFVNPASSKFSQVEPEQLSELDELDGDGEALRREYDQKKGAAAGGDPFKETRAPWER